MNKDLDNIIKEMTLDEKAAICCGRDFWNLHSVERLKIPSIMVTDGPHGLRKQAEDSDHLGLSKSVPATCFPSGAGLACSWDRNVLDKVGGALATEALAENVSVLLGPALNIKRSPLCGRNFEYLSEDPYLTSELATSYVNSVQSRGVGTSIKHFAANNQETRRMTISSEVDERTLREIYLPGFEGPVKNAQPWTVMCAYNKLNGEYCSENPYLLDCILRKEWGFKGFVVSDWGAVNERVDALKAGLELEMPSSNGTGIRKIIEAINSGELEMNVLDEAVRRVLGIIYKAAVGKAEVSEFDSSKNHNLAREVAGECLVLLKNEDTLLPLKKEGKIAVIGELSMKPRYQGGGSSHINPTKIEIPFEELQNVGAGATLSYSQGYSLDTDEIDESMFSAAVKMASEADVAVLYIGLPERLESEGYDRVDMELPANQNALIDAVAEVNRKTVVVLANGSPVEMPWVSRVGAILEAYLGGQAVGGAIADILFGDVNPSGKLAESFPEYLGQNPSFTNFPGGHDKVEYREGLFIGYRYYDKTGIPVLFPFGHGLSYTSFRYSGLKVNQISISDKELLKVSISIKNTGHIAGKEIVQLYVRDLESSVVRPDKELKAFAKVSLNPGEERVVEFKLGKRAFAFYNTQIGDWYVESGEFEILVGASATDIRQCITVAVEGTTPIKKTYDLNTMFGDLMSDPELKDIMADFDLQIFPEMDLGDNEMLEQMTKFLPLRALTLFNPEMVPENKIKELINKLNNRKLN